MASRQINLSVNEKSIEMDDFVQEFMDHVVSGMIVALKRTGEIKTLHLSIDGDQVVINLNNSPVSMKPFVASILKNTIFGMVSSLKGVSQIKRLRMENSSSCQKKEKYQNSIEILSKRAAIIAALPLLIQPASAGFFITLRMGRAWGEN